MRINFVNRTLITRLAAMTLIAVCLFQLPAQAATTSTLAEDKWVDVSSFHWGVGIANGQSMRATLANLVPSGPDEIGPIVIGASLILFDERGGAVAQSEKVEILTGKFHSFDIHRSGISLRSDRKTGRIQVFAELKVYAKGLEEDEAKAINERAAEFLPVSFELINPDGATSVASITDGTSNTLFVGERPPSEGGSGVALADGSV